MFPEFLCGTNTASVGKPPPRIYDEGNRIVVERLGNDPVAEGKELLKTK